MDGDKRAGAARTEVMNGPRQQFLARAGFSMNQDGRIAGGKGGKKFDDRLQTRAPADEVPDLPPPLEFTAKFFHDAEVTKGLGPTDHPPLAVAKQRRGKRDGNPVPLGVDDEGRLVDDGAACHEGFAQSAVALAQARAEDFETSPSDGVAA